MSVAIPISKKGDAASLPRQLAVSDVSNPEGNAKRLPGISPKQT